MVVDSHLSHQVLRNHGFALVILVIRGKLQLVDVVTEVMSNALLFQVRDQFINVLVVRRLEGTARGEMDVAGDPINTETTGDVAALVRLFFQLVCPTFFYTLLYPVRPDILRESLRENART